MDLISIDPGLNSSAALLRFGHNSGTVFLDMVDLPTRADGEKRQIDVPGLCELLERWEPDLAVVENVQPMPSIPGANGLRRSMGAASSFRFGMACGMIRATLEAYELPVDLVHPQSWKRHFGLKGADKQPGVELIKSLQPETAQFITLKKHHGRSDAGLLALYYANKRGLL